MQITLEAADEAAAMAAGALKGMEESGDGDGMTFEDRQVELKARRSEMMAAREELDVLIASRAKATDKMQRESLNSLIAAIEVCCVEYVCVWISQ